MPEELATLPHRYLPQRRHHAKLSAAFLGANVWRGRGRGPPARRTREPAPHPVCPANRAAAAPLTLPGLPLPLSLLPLPSRAPTRMAAPYSNAPDRSLDSQGPSQGCADVDLELKTLERVRRARPAPAVAGTDRTRITGLSGHSEGHPSARGRCTAPEGLRRDEVPRSAPWPRPRRPEPRGNLQASGRSEGSPRPPSSSRGGGPLPTPPDSAVEISGKICIELRT